MNSLGGVKVEGMILDTWLQGGETWGIHLAEKDGNGICVNNFFHFRLISGRICNIETETMMK